MAEERNTLWRILCDDFFQKFIDGDATVLDLAAGYCEFINNIKCKEKIAVDLNPVTRERAARDVQVHEAASTRLPENLTGTVDVVFASNFFEHLDDKNELMETLEEAYRVLKPGGRIMVLQPNIRLVGHKYWDYIDHTLPLTEKSLAEALRVNKFRVIWQRTRFLPYSTDSRIPIAPILIKLYLKTRIAQYIMGKQTFMIAEKTASEDVWRG